MARYGNKGQKSTPDIWSRDFLIFILLAVFLVIIIGRLVYVQVIKGHEYAELAESAHTSEITLTARRGTVYDRNGEVIASNIDATTIYVNPKEVTDQGKLARILSEVLSDTYGKSYDDYYSIVAQSNLSFAYIQRKADVEIATKLKERLKQENVAGIHYLSDTKRVYPNGTVGSQVIGAVDTDGKGIAGLEMEYNSVLAGQDGSMSIEKGMKDIPIANGKVDQVDAVDGIDIVTSVDINLQKHCEESLLAAVKQYEAKGGTVTVLDASTGEIYASCSYSQQGTETVSVETTVPVETSESSVAAGEEGAQGAEGSQASTEAKTKTVTETEEVAKYGLEVGKLGAITDAYEPGSTFKPFTAISVLTNNKNITPASTYTVPYSLNVYDSTISDSHEHDTEDMSLTRILAESSNVGITLASREVSTETLYNTYKTFGFGTKTGCDYPGDTAGSLKKSSDWDGVMSATVTFGQGLTVTGLQLIRAYGAIEQGGIERTPHFLTDVPNDDAKAQELMADLTKSSTVADSALCTQTANMLTSVITEGTGEAAAVDGFTVTGKTGTAEVASSYGGYETNSYIMSFCGWLYGSSSHLVCLVTLDRPHSNYGGGDVCGPVFADIMSFAANRYQIDAQAN